MCTYAMNREILMFSGIIENIGTIEECRSVGKGTRITISSPLTVAAAGEAGVGTNDRERVGLGDSIAIFGVCLTVEEVHPPNQFVVVCGQETLSATILGELRPGSRVHLERAMRVGDRLDGHVVQGHVDGVGSISEIYQAQESWILWVKAPAELLPYIAVKGSICLNGVSLTVNDVKGEMFRCNIIPYTIKETIFETSRQGDLINIEIDVIARYVERMLQLGHLSPSQKTNSVEDRLREMGYSSKYSGGR